MAKDITGLLVNWLNEIIYLQEVDDMLYKRFEIKRLEKDYLEAEVWGERFNPDKHVIKGEVKAATYHQVEIKEEKGIWKIKVIFDV
jgi:SHS2 domain-containing protein